MLKPSACLVLQGSKRTLVGQKVLSYAAGSFILAGIDMPIAGQVVEATPQKPYLGLGLTLDLKTIATLLVDGKFPLGTRSGAQSGAAMGKVGPALGDAVLR